MAVDTAAPNKLRWGELEDDGDEDLDFLLLPPKQVIGPDEKGIKRVIEYKFNDDGNKVKVTRTIRVTKLGDARLSRRAVERRNWAKFGDAVREDVGARLTIQSPDEILLERPKAPEENKPVPQPGKPGGVLMVCRSCGKKGDHWTARCPYLPAPSDEEPFVEKPTTPDAKGGAYVPPGMRPGADRTSVGTDMRRRNDDSSVRVTNLSEDTREQDLKELFMPFGHVTRTYVAIDHKTGVSRGFGFVNFANKEDAERAISKLNGYGYDNLILRVDWATPRPN